MELGWSSLDLGGSRMGRENGEGSRSAPPRVLTLEEAKKRTTLAGVGGKVEVGVEEEEVQFQSFLHHHFHNLHHQQQQQQQQQTTQKKRKTTATATAGAGRIVAVPGGHIVRSTSSKDRHSKVCTAKGLRDRRVRLSAHTAIEFYDVQDRLGYDRPSMAVDWLLKNAKAAIDGLDELPPWQPTAATGRGGVLQEVLTDVEPAVITNSMNSYSDATAGIGAAIESFPMVPSSYPPDLLSRTSSHVQDLRLSLDTAETAGRGSNSVGGGGGYLFNFPAPQLQQQSMMIDPRFFTHQRGPLQSSSSHPVPSWMDQIAPSHITSMHPPPVPALFHRASSSFPNVEFGASGGGGSGFSGFVMPTSWIQGREHMDGDVSDKPAASSHR